MKIITEAEALERVRALVTYGTTQIDIAKKAGVSKPSVSAIMSGKRSMSDEILKVAGIQRRVEYILLEEDAPEVDVK